VDYFVTALLQIHSDICSVFFALQCIWWWWWYDTMSPEPIEGRSQPELLGP